LQLEEGFMVKNLQEEILERSGTVAATALVAEIDR
jgi:hypothetical protein